MLSSGALWGRTLISDKGYPLGFGGVYTLPNAKGEPVAIGFFYGGPNQVFVRKYTKLAMRAMADLFRELAGLGFTHIYALADRRIDKAVDLALWLGGTPTGDTQEEGDLYVFDPRKTPLSRLKE